MAKSGNNENKIEKLVRVGFYELEKTIGKGAVDCVLPPKRLPSVI